MLKLIPLGNLRNRTELDRVLLGQDARLMDNGEIPINRFHELTHSEHGIVVLFIPKVTEIDEKGAVKKDGAGNPIFTLGKPVASIFRHSTCAPIHFDAQANSEKGTLVLAPALAWVG